MKIYNIDIGSGDDKLTHDDVIAIEKEFHDEHMPQEKREQHLMTLLHSEKNIKRYPAVLGFKDVIVCVGQNLDVLIHDDNKEEIKKTLEENTIPRFKKIFPNKNINPSEHLEYWELHEFDRISKPRKNNSEKKTRISTRTAIIIAAIISAIGGVAAAIILYLKPPT